jgi:hypothetical protein
LLFVSVLAALPVFWPVPPGVVPLDGVLGAFRPDELPLVVSLLEPEGPLMPLLPPSAPAPPSARARGRFSPRRPSGRAEDPLLPCDAEPPVDVEPPALSLQALVPAIIAAAEPRTIHVRMVIVVVS